MRLCLGPRAFDLGARALVMGIIEVDPHVGTNGVVARAGRLAADGADILDLDAGGLTAEGGPVAAAEDERVAAAVSALATRFDVAVSVRAERAAVAAAAFSAGAFLAHAGSVPAGPARLVAAAEAGAGVVVTAALPPHAAGADDVVTAVESSLRERAAEARAAGIPDGRIVVEARLGPAPHTGPSLALLRASDRLAGLGYPLLLSTVDGAPARTAGAGTAREAALAAAALGVTLGVRVVRTSDVCGARRVCDAIAAVLEAA